MDIMNNKSYNFKDYKLTELKQMGLDVDKAVKMFSLKRQNYVTGKQFCSLCKASGLDPFAVKKEFESWSDINAEVENDMFYGYKTYQNETDLKKAVDDYFVNFIIPQAKEKGYVLWDNGTKAKCSVAKAKGLYKLYSRD